MLDRFLAYYTEENNHYTFQQKNYRSNTWFTLPMCILWNLNWQAEKL